MLVAPRTKTGRLSVERGRARAGGNGLAGERPRLLLDGLEAAAVQGILDPFDGSCIFVVVEVVPGPFERTGDRADWNVVDGLRHDEGVDYDQEYRDLVREGQSISFFRQRIDGGLTIPVWRLQAGAPLGCPGGDFVRYLSAMKLATGRKVATSGSPGVMGSLRLSTTDLVVSVRPFRIVTMTTIEGISYQKYAPIATNAVDTCQMGSQIPSCLGLTEGKGRFQKEGGADREQTREGDTYDCQEHDSRRCSESQSTKHFDRAVVAHFLFVWRVVAVELRESSSSSSSRRGWGNI